MKVLIIGAALAALIAPASAEPIIEYTMRDPGSVAPGLQYTVTGTDGLKVTVIEGQPRWSLQHRTDERLVPGGDTTTVNILQRGRHYH